MKKFKVTFANGVVRSTKAKTTEAAVAKLKKYAGGTAVISVSVRA